MTQNELSQLTDPELLEKAKKMKTSSIINAALVGVMAGIIIYSAVKGTIGFFTFIPLLFIYKIVKDSKNDKVLKQLLKERNLNQ